MRRKPNLDARIGECANLLVERPQELRGRWLDEFGYAELHIELGCGKGRFTVETAKAEQDVLFAAFEKTANVLVIAMERATREGLNNVRFANTFAENLTDFIARGEASRIYLNFSDPWPSNKHAKRRLTTQRNLELYRQLLCAGGEIHFKTDNLPFFEFSLREFERSGYVLIEEVHDLHKNGPVGVMTDYELKFHEQGMPIYKCVVRG
jgi:tRNA (guanine-N7-)-methyltransferase